MTTAAPNLTYDDATHTYKIDGVVVPSITQVIGASNLWDDSHWSEEAALRGRYIHKAIELDIAGRLPQESLQRHGDRIPGCVKSWRKFRADNPGEVVASELKLCDPVFRFAGRLDLLYREGRTLNAIDIKTGAPEPWHALQTAAHEHLARVDPTTNLLVAIHSVRRMTLHISETGYKVSVHSDPNDWAVFQSALTLAHWRNTNEKRTGG